MQAGQRLGAVLDLDPSVPHAIALDLPPVALAHLRPGREAGSISGVERGERGVVVPAQGERLGGCARLLERRSRVRGQAVRRCVAEHAERASARPDVARGFAAALAVAN